MPILSIFKKIRTNIAISNLQMKDGIKWKNEEKKMELKKMMGIRDVLCLFVYSNESTDSEEMSIKIIIFTFVNSIDRKTLPELHSKDV